MAYEISKNLLTSPNEHTVSLIEDMKVQNIGTILGQLINVDGSTNASHRGGGEYEMGHITCLNNNFLNQGAHFVFSPMTHFIQV